MLNQIEHATSQVVRIATFEEAHQGVVEVVAINSCIRNDDGNAHGHELEDFGAEGLVSEIVLSLRNNAEVGFLHDACDLSQAPRFVKHDASFEPQGANQICQQGAGRAFAVYVKIGVGNVAADFGECPYGDIEALMPVEGAGIEQQETSVRYGSFSARMKNGTVRRIQHHGTVRGSHRAADETFLPDAIGDNDVAG